MEIITILIVGLFLASFALFVYLIVSQIKEWRPTKASRTRSKKSQHRKKKERQQKVKWQVIIGAILLMLLLILSSLLNIQQKINHLLQTDSDLFYQQEQLEKEWNEWQDQERR